MALCKAKCVVYTNMPFYHRFNRVGSISNQVGFKRTDIRRAISTDKMVEYVERNKPQHLMGAYSYCFTFYMTALNQIIFYQCQKENTDLYNQIITRLKNLYISMGAPEKVLPFQVYYAYRLFLINVKLYYIVVRIYYKDVKKEMGGKRQR